LADVGSHKTQVPPKTHPGHLVARQVHPRARSRSLCRPNFNRKGSLLWQKVIPSMEACTVLENQTLGDTHHGERRFIGLTRTPELHHYRRLPSGQVHPTASSTCVCPPDINRKGSLLWPKVIHSMQSLNRFGKSRRRESHNWPEQAWIEGRCGSNGPVLARHEPTRPSATGDHPQARFTPQQEEDTSAVQTSRGNVLCLGRR